MTDIKATYIVPTTGDRGPLLKHAIDSILDQTIYELEVFIIGDGVNNLTRSIINDICNKDQRVRFFDHPKHVRRGEPYRHKALQEAKGEIVCYLIDRDLLLPNHLELMWKNTRQYNFVKLNSINVFANGEVQFGNLLRFSGSLKDQPKYMHKDTILPISSVGHTLEFYNRLPIGWDTTPENTATDRFMWQKFLDHPDCNMVTDHTPGMLYFKRGSHPGWPTEKRLADTEKWLPYIKEPKLTAKLFELAQNNIINHRTKLIREKHRLKRDVERLSKN